MRQYIEEFKEQILAECQEVGNVSLVARRHQISENTIYAWIKTKRKNGSLKPYNIYLPSAIFHILYIFHLPNIADMGR
ncbi:MAG: transposase [Firmicutes bacterium]|nr:transposase [Bacillota bacterium]